LSGLALPPPIVIVAPAAAAPRAFTRQVPEGTWAALPRALRLVLPFGPFTDQDALGEATVAARAWSEVPCSAVRLVVAGARGESVTSGDGISHVIFHSEAWPPELVPRALAQTVVVVDGRGNLTDADVHVNGKDHTFSLDGRPGTADLRSIVTHELGHALGLGHSNDPIATMTAAASGTRFRTLEADDEAGACALYAGRGAPRCPEAACPAPFVCVAGACERPSTPRTTCAPCVREADACDNAGAGARCVDLDDGRVCARACDEAHPCGAGFTCRATTSAGDFQCIADDRCLALGVPCAPGASCGEGFVCAGGRCVGALAPALDGGPPRDAAPPPGPAAATDTGCRAGGSAGDGGVLTGGLLAFSFVLARRRRRPR